MDKEGGYQIVHGPKLHKIKADNIKILFSGHGNEGLKTTVNLPSKPSIDLFSCSKPSSPTETTR
jgi:hypothetical protein